MTYQVKQLSELVHLKSGNTPSKSRSAYWGGEIPWASTKDLKVDRLWDTEDHLTDEGMLQAKQSASVGEILISVRGMALAKTLPMSLAMRPMAFNQDLKSISSLADVDSRYLFYWMKANEQTILGIADEAGHGTKRIQTDRLLSLKMEIPPISTQRKIADILSAYDDLIENNTRRIAILEEMAQRLYQEWFVHFRYPGHEHVPLVESELGLIPEGWEVKRLGEVATIVMGQSPKSEF